MLIEKDIAERMNLLYYRHSRYYGIAPAHKYRTYLDTIFFPRDIIAIEKDDSKKYRSGFNTMPCLYILYILIVLISIIILTWCGFNIIKVF